MNQHERSGGQQGFTLMEVLIAMMVSMILMASVFLLLHRGQTSFVREPEVSDMNAAARSGLSRVGKDLTIAGYNTPPNISVMWQDGGGNVPDELTIVYADPTIPVSQPKPCGPGASARWRGERAYQYAQLQFFTNALGAVNPLLQAALDPASQLLMMAQRRGGGRRGGGRRGGRGGGGGSTGGGSTGGGGNSNGNGNGGGGSGGGPCNTIGRSATLNIDPYSMEPQPADYETAYNDGMTLFAIQGPNGDPACDNVAPAIVPFELTQPPKCTGAGGANSGPAGCATLNLNHNPGGSVTGLNLPGGFDNQVSAECAVIGFFHVIQYRVSPLPPADNPQLERRDLSIGEAWAPVSPNIENLQVQYMQGFIGTYQDVPPTIPVGADPNTWVTGVRVTVAGRSESTNLEGATAGVFDPNDTHLRRSFTTTVSLRNNLNLAAAYTLELGMSGWN